MAQEIAEASANAYAGAAPYLTTPATATAIATYATAAAARATTIRAMLGLGAFTPVPASPAAIISQLLPYYVTVITVLHADATPWFVFLFPLCAGRLVHARSSRRWR